MSARSPRWELCKGSRGYWVRFRASNGRIVIGNPEQGYSRRRDALRSIELVTGLDVLKAEECWYLLDLFKDIEVRDCTGEAA